MNSYNKYKHIDLLWLKSIPEHWDVKRAKTMFKKVNRPVRDSDETVTCFRDGTVTLRKNRRTKGFTESLKEIGYQGIEKGDFVIHQMDAFAGAIGVSDSDGKGTPVYSVCIPKSNLYNSFYYAQLVREMAKNGFIQSLYRGIRERSSDFRFDTFGKQYLPIPPRTEQEQIVSFLDFRISKISKFIKDKKCEIELLKEQKQAEINQAVTKGLISDVPMRESGVEWLGEIPEHWEVKYLSQASKEQSISNKNIKNQNLLSLSYGKIINKDINTTDGLLPASFDTYQVVDSGNIILRLTDLQNDHKSLRTGLVTQNGIITSAYTCLLPNQSIVPEYLHSLLHSFDIRKVFYGMGGGLRQSIGFKDIRRLKILVPPINEQKSIIKKCITILNRNERLILGIEQEISLIGEYKTRLISDVVTGKVNVKSVKPDRPLEHEIL